MRLHLKPINEQVIVITGATSGIGLTTALMAAHQGACVVAAARSERNLKEVVRQIQKSGGRAIAVPTDVAERSQVEKLAKAAVKAFGRIDTWVNNAGVSIYGHIEEVSDEDSRNLFETNFWGVVNGSLTALPYLKRRGGALINLGSIASDIGLPLQGMYSASKHAIKGFTDALRIELENESAPVSVTLIKPAAMATQIAQHARNYTGREPKLPPPVYAPEEVAHAILQAAQHEVRDAYVGGAGRMMVALNHFLPGAMDKIGVLGMNKQFQPDHSKVQHDDNLTSAGKVSAKRGQGTGFVLPFSAYTRAVLHPATAGGIALAVGVGLAALFSSANSNSDSYKTHQVM